MNMPQQDPNEHRTPTPAEAQKQKDMDKWEEDLLDDAIEQTFPASDPIAVPSHDEALKVFKTREEKGKSRPAD